MREGKQKLTGRANANTRRKPVLAVKEERKVPGTIFKKRKSSVTGTEHSSTQSSPVWYLPDILGHVLGVNENRKQVVDVQLKLIIAF